MYFRTAQLTLAEDGKTIKVAEESYDTSIITDKFEKYNSLHAKKNDVHIL